MKIGIITYWTFPDNYGQQLQCYALQHYLRSQGHDAFLIKYAPVAVKKSKVVEVVKDILRFLLGFVSKRRRTINAKIRLERRVAATNKLNNPRRGFDAFREKYIKSTDCVYRSLSELQNNPPQADIYITGSDQVWNNPLNEPATATWYLQFGDSKTKRISYAASMGRRLDDSERAIFKKYISAFDGVSVREEAMLEDCKSVGIENAVVTVDPTLLLGRDAYPMSNVRHEGKFMFVYVLNVETADEIYWNSISDYLAKEGLTCRMVCASGYIKGRQLVPDVSPEYQTIPEWLASVRDSQCVMTTSFHGVVFAIVMHKPFLAVLLANRYSKGNSRVINLLKQLGLSDRIYSPTADLATQMNAPIDWDSVENMLAELRIKSVEFLGNYIR